MNIENLPSIRLLNAKEVAKALNVCRAQAYRLMQIGEIPTVRILGSVRVSLEDLLLYIDENTSKGRRLV
jgi:excisionase family DNA binding protein